MRRLIGGFEANIFSCNTVGFKISADISYSQLQEN